MKDAIVAPAPGSAPMKNPMPDPRSHDGTERRNSARVIHTGPLIDSRCSA
jgi:hypothetical protein